MINQALNKALYLEFQGLKDEALSIYANILKKQPDNAIAKVAIRRLSGIRQKFDGVNQDKSHTFITINNQTDIREFEQWLLKMI